MRTNIINAYKTFWVKYLDIKTRCSVKNYWKVICIHIGIYISLFISLIIGMILRSQGLDVSDSLKAIFGHIMLVTPIILMPFYFILTALPTLTITIRRLNDANLPWFIFLLFFTPTIIGPIIAIYCLLLPGKDSAWSFYNM
ncbi:DUF805 domain-containing protein [Lactococcus petauri]|uniref:DUF805 domain-containing protein n=1 Tax=Lactococcus petauri TaxID=1940789 RepID=UPI0013FD8ACF|nr:DUF805 domain-containing protein [Lactococcus petauri]